MYLEFEEDNGGSAEFEVFWPLLDAFQEVEDRAASFSEPTSMYFGFGNGLNVLGQRIVV